MFWKRVTVRRLKSGGRRGEGREKSKYRTYIDVGHLLFHFYIKERYKLLPFPQGIDIMASSLVIYARYKSISSNKMGMVSSVKKQPNRAAGPSMELSIPASYAVLATSRTPTPQYVTFPPRVVSPRAVDRFNDVIMTARIQVTRGTRRAVYFRARVVDEPIRRESGMFSLRSYFSRNSVAR